MFRLDEAIEHWKETLIGDGTINAEQSLELESHLRESMVHLRSLSLSEQEAFLVAANRFGLPVELQQEFEKNNPTGRWRYRVFWMLVGTLGVEAVGSTAAAITAMIGAAMAASGFAGSVSASAMLVATAALWIVFFTVGFRKRQRLGRSGESLPIRWIVAIGATIIVAPLVSTFVRVSQAKLVAPSWFGEFALYSTIGGNALHLCIVVFCFAALWKLNDRDAVTTD